MDQNQGYDAAGGSAGGSPVGGAPGGGNPLDWFTKQTTAVKAAIGGAIGLVVLLLILLVTGVFGGDNWESECKDLAKEAKESAEAQPFDVSEDEFYDLCIKGVEEAKEDGKSDDEIQKEFDEARNEISG